MSIYLFKTENFYGGETRVFTNKIHAEEHLAYFINLTDGKIDAVIEEHKPEPTNTTFLIGDEQTELILSGTYRPVLYLHREDGWERSAENVKWKPVNAIY